MGGLLLPSDLERAALSAQLLSSVGGEMFGRARTELALSASPHGLLPQCGVELARHFSARFAFASLFLPAAGAEEKPKDRLAFVVAFVVAGLHLAAASYPHLPWFHWASGRTRYSALLADETRINVDADYQIQGSPGKPRRRRAKFQLESLGKG